MSDVWIDRAFEAARGGDRERLLTVLDEAPDRIDERGENGAGLLHVAAERDDGEMVRLLLDRGADLEATAEWGQTPLEWAANVNAKEAAGVLIERGAGRTHLWTRAALGHTAEVERCLANGVPAGRPLDLGADLSGWPEDTAFRRGDPISDAFYIACRNGHREAAELLHARGADVHARGYFGATTLHWTAAGGHAELAEWLIDQGADPTLTDPRFESDAAGWAREFGHEALAARLRERADGANGARPPSGGA